MNNRPIRPPQYFAALGSPWGLAVLAGCVGVLVGPWDLWLSGLFQHFGNRGDIRKTIGLSEAFAHGSGVFVILGSLWWIDVDKRKKIAQAAVLTLVTGLTANIAKAALPRIRPHSLEQFEGAIANSGWFPQAAASFWESSHRSFPSGHAATAVALGLALTRVYPRGRWIFAGLSILACCQRVVSGAHFPTDVLAGTMIAFLVSGFFQNKVIGQSGDFDPIRDRH